MTRTCLDLFSGEGGWHAAFADAGGWQVVTVDTDARFGPDIRADVLDLRPSDLPDADVVLASPPCTAFSMAASGTHIDADGRPVSDWGAESIALTHHTRGLCRALDPEWYVIENPMGGMRKELGPPDAHVWWCRYGSDRAKPTDLWGRLPPSFDARRCWNGNADCHHEPAPRGSDAGTQRGDRDAAERARIPYGLSEAVLAAVESPAPEQRTLSEVSP